jgi:hypothetical protein
LLAKERKGNQRKAMNGFVNRHEPISNAQALGEKGKQLTRRLERCYYSSKTNEEPSVHILNMTNTLWNKCNRKPRLGIPTNRSCCASCRGKKEKKEEEEKREER